MGSHLRTTERHLPYGITQCYLPPDRGERAQAGVYSIYPHQRDGRLSWPEWLVIYRDGSPVQRQSSIKVLTEPGVRQLRKSAGFRHPGTYPKNRWVFWVHPPKKPTPQKHFYFNLILVYTLYATNNAIFYCFKAFKALSYGVFVLFYLFFPACPKTHWVGLFKKKPGFFTCHS